MLRGEVWRFQPIIVRPGASTLRLIGSADALNTSDRGTVLTLQVLDTDPNNLLAIGTEFGWASAMHPEATPKNRLLERVGVVSPDVMERISGTVRTVWDL